MHKELYISYLKIYSDNISYQEKARPVAESPGLRRDDESVGNPGVLWTLFFKEILPNEGNGIYGNKMGAINMLRKGDQEAWL